MVKCLNLEADVSQYYLPKRKFNQRKIMIQIKFAEVRSHVCNKEVEMNSQRSALGHF